MSEKHNSGQFIRFHLDFIADGEELPAEAQALRILDQMHAPYLRALPGVAITYSANQGQTEAIKSAYDAGKWNTHTSGMNQAEVMAAMERLLGTKQWSHLQGKARIAPITTIPHPGTDQKTWAKQVAVDLERIASLLQDGWAILGWINQDSTPRFAVGGGVAGTLPSAIDQQIQDTLNRLASEYPTKTQ